MRQSKRRENELHCFEPSIWPMFSRRVAAPVVWPPGLCCSYVPVTSLADWRHCRLQANGGSVSASAPVSSQRRAEAGHWSDQPRSRVTKFLHSDVTWAENNYQHIRNTWKHSHLLSYLTRLCGDKLLQKHFNKKFRSLFSG